MKEFVYINQNNEELVFADNIEILDKTCDVEYLVSNDANQKAQIYAPEINFYIKNTQENMLQIAKDVSLLYETRAVCFDKALDMDYQKNIGNSVILSLDIKDNQKADLIADARKIIENLENKQEILNILNNTKFSRLSLFYELKKNDFNVVLLGNFEVKFVYGEVGEISVIDREDKEVIADFLLAENGFETMFIQSGCYEINNISDTKLIENLLSKTPIYRYKSNFTYNDKICQYHARRDLCCGKCADVCPTVAILRDDDKKQLQISHIDCIDCGECVGVCPSGSIEYSKMPLSAIDKIATLFDGKNIILARSDVFENLNISLPLNFLPFAINNYGIVDQVFLITLLQSSGRAIVLFMDKASISNQESIELVNAIYFAKYGFNPIVVVEDRQNLKSALNSVNNMPDFDKFTINHTSIDKRDIFSKRVSFLVGESDFGIVPSGDFIRYGKVVVNPDSCTLCLSCVGACNTGAFFADTSDNSLKFNASLCTTCGYCQTSCAEKDTLKLYRSGIELNKEYFNYKILAQDELFACIECGKKFATKKSVLKIADMMTPIFGNNSLKIKTLYCCADCKAKLMITHQIKRVQKDF